MRRLHVCLAVPVKVPVLFSAVHFLGGGIFHRHRRDARRDAEIVDIFARAAVPFHFAVSHQPGVDEIFLPLVRQPVMDRLHVQKRHAVIVLRAVHVDAGDIAVRRIAPERLVELLFGFGGEIAVIFRFAIVAAHELDFFHGNQSTVKEHVFIGVQIAE